MTKVKMVGVKIRKEQNGMDVLETKLEDRPQQCKKCKLRPRATGSSRCRECTNGYKTHIKNMENLQHKIDKQEKLEA